MSYKYIDPRNVRHREQLEIMERLEAEGKDPLDPEFINQPIMFETDFWFVCANKFPYEEIKHQFLIVARGPVYKIEDMSPEMWDDLRKTWLRLQEGYGLPGGGLCFRFGDTFYSGASLTRLHVHLIIVNEGQKTRFNIGGNVKQKEDLL